MRQTFILLMLFGVSGIGSIAALSGCGDGVNASASASGSGNGSGSGSGSGSASASGTITQFGSLYVNGKKFETSDVSVEQDGESKRCTISRADTCGLKQGMVVTVNGSITGEERTAATVHQNDLVEGLVQTVGADGLSLVVLGQTVLVDDTTVIDNNVPGQNLLKLVPGIDHVEVNGHIRLNGVIQATFIELQSVGETPEVQGFVSGHVSRASTFKIGHLTVNYGGASIGDMPIPNGNNWDGRFVEVRGARGSFTPGPNIQTEGTLIASNVEPKDGRSDNDVDEFEIEGFVTQAGTPNGQLLDFTLATTPVTTTPNTEFRGGTIDEIVVGAKLSAEGRFANGVLEVDHVKFHESVKLEGDIVKIGPHTFAIAGLINISVTVNSQTEYRGSSSLADFTDGNHVRVRGRVTGTNTVIATRVERRSPDNDVHLQGPVQSTNGNEIAILGVSIDTSTIDHFESVSGASTSRAAFLAEVKENSLVKVEGTLHGSIVLWDEVELED